MSVDTDRREEAKRLIADGTLSLHAIAKRVGVSRQSIMVWQREPEFAEAVRTRRHAKLQEALEKPYARRAERIGLLSFISEKLVAVIKARAKMVFDTPEEAEEYRRQGGATGLITVKHRALGGAAAVVEEYVVDTALLAELRQTLRHLAVETGDWKPFQQDEVMMGDILIQFDTADHGPE